MRRRLLPVLCLLLVACTVTDSRDFKEIPNNEFPAGLRETIPPTSTTTTTSTTVPGPTSTEVTTTTIAAPTEVIQLFYVQGTRIRAVSIEETKPEAPEQSVDPQRKLFDLVQRKGMLSDEVRLATVLSIGAVLIGDLRRGNITVDLGSSVDAVLPEDLPLFFAQIALTVLAPSRQGQVYFLQNGKPYPAVKGDQTVLEPGQTVAWEDYADLIIGDAQPPVTTTTTTLWGPP